jgi:thiamine-phosphate pyrophosphorylase
MPVVRGLYPIVDLAVLSRHGVPALRFAELVLRARPALLQLRAKTASAREVLDCLRRLQPLCEQSGTLLFVNDRPDLALLAGAAGVHLGQEDVPVEELGKLPGRLRVGLSTHNAQQLACAIEARPDYIAFGPVFATGSKANPEPVVGLEGLAQAAESCARAAIPLIAIGGITLERAPEVAKYAPLAAVIADLLSDGGSESAIAARASALQEALGSTSATRAAT